MTIEAVLMTAPGRPLERRRVDAPTPAPGGAVLETVASEVCGTDVHLWHGRLAGVPYPIIPGHVSVGRLLEAEGPMTDVEGRAIPLGTLVTFYDVFGACGACWQCAVARAAESLPEAPGLRDHRGRRRRVARRMVAAHRDPPGRARRAASRGSRRGGLPGRRLRTADRLPRGRAGRSLARRHGRGPGQRTGGVERGDLRAARGRAAGLRRRSAAGSAGRGAAAGRRGRPGHRRRSRGPRTASAGFSTAPPGAARTWSSRRREIRPPCPRASRCCATRAAP